MTIPFESSECMLDMSKNGLFGNGLSGNGLSGNGLSGNGLSGNGLSGNGIDISELFDFGGILQDSIGK